MGERMLGMETEYGFAVVGSPRPDPSEREASEHLMDLARARCPHLLSMAGHGIFLGNGARFYIDMGAHPEYCTPEADNPWEVVSHVRAGDELLGELRKELSARLGCETIINKANLDYNGSGATWACHENYGYRDRLPNLAAQLIPHLVSRIIYTGAGGLNPRSSGIEFCLSPRVHFLEGVISAGSTSGRGIFHSKDEPLAGNRWRRLHVICGESVCSDLSVWLKIASTALVVAMAEAGLDPAGGLEIKDPLAAMQAINADPFCKAKVLLTSSQSMTALEIQRQYLQAAESNLGHPAMPAWADKACMVWRDTLARLEQAPEGVALRFDWAIKHSLYQQHAVSQGIDPATLPVWNHVIRELARRGREFSVTHLTTSEILSPNSRFEPQLKALTPLLELHRLSWNTLPQVVELRKQICELDLRFSQLPDGIFAALAQAGLLRHTVPGVNTDSVQLARHSPPARGRARIRGELIQRLRNSHTHTCDWSAVWNAQGAQVDLSDPFLERLPEWRKAEQPPMYRGAPGLERMMQVANQLYDQGSYERAYVLLQELEAQAANHHQAHARLLQLMVYVQCRRGFFPEALELVNRRLAAGPLTFSLAHEFLGLYRFYGLVPLTEQALAWIAKCDEILAGQPAQDAYELCGYQANKAYIFARVDRHAEARNLLQPLTENRSWQMAQPRIFARALAALGDVCLMQGEKEQARHWFEQAAQIQSAGVFQGDLADLTLTGQLRLTRARAFLDQAKGYQTRLGSRMGIARSLLLEARLFPESAPASNARDIVRDLANELPALRHCAVTQKILANWEQWGSGHMPPGERDYFWGV